MVSNSTQGVEPYLSPFTTTAEVQNQPRWHMPRPLGSACDPQATMGRIGETSAMRRLCPTALRVRCRKTGQGDGQHKESVYREKSRIFSQLLIVSAAKCSPTLDIFRRPVQGEHGNAAEPRNW